MSIASMEPPQTSENIIGQHYGRVYRLCCLLLADSHEAEDVTQEVFLKAHEQARSAPVGNWGAWLTRVAVNAVHDRRRVGWWPRWRRLTDAIDEIDIASPEPTPEDVVIGAETRERVGAAFWKLSTRQREVFVLRHLEGWSTDAVATSLGMRPGTVKRHLFRAVHALSAAVHRGG